MNDLLGKLVVVLGMDMKQFEAGLAQAQTKMSRFRKTITTSMTNFGQKVKDAGWALRRMGIDISTYLIAPMALVGTAAFNLYKGFESSMTKINSLVGVAREQIQEWNKDVLNISKMTGKGPKELADALYFVTSAGVRGAEALEVLQASAKAAAAGLGETKDIADLVTSAVNAYGKQNIKSSHATDVLVAAVKEGKAEAADFSQVMGRLLPVASNMGVEFNQVAAATAALTRTGSQSAEAATYLRRAMFTILKPSQDARKAFEEMGTSVEEVRDVFRSQGLMEGLMMLKTLTEQNNEEMSRIFPNVRAFMGVIDLLGENLDDNRAIFERLNNVMGLTEQAFNTASETLEVKFNKRVSAVKVELIRLGEVMKGPILDVMDMLIQKLTYVSNRFHSMSEAQKANIIQTTITTAGYAALGTAVSILTITFGNFIIMLSKLTNWLLLMPKHLGKIKKAFIAISTVIKANPYLILIGAFIALLPKMDEWASKLRREIKLWKEGKVKIDAATKALLDYSNTMNKMPEGTLKIRTMQEEQKGTALGLDKRLKAYKSMNERQLKDLQDDLVQFKQQIEDIKIENPLAAVFGDKMIAKIDKNLVILTGRIEELKKAAESVDGGGKAVTGYMQQLMDDIEDLQKQQLKAPKAEGALVIQAKIEDKQQALDEIANFYTDIEQQREDLSNELSVIDYNAQQAMINATKQGMDRRLALLELEKDNYLKNLDDEAALTEKAEQQKKQIREKYLDEYNAKRQQILLENERKINDEILDMQREAIELKIQNEKDGVAEQVALLEQRKKWTKVDLDQMVKDNEMSAQQAAAWWKTYLTVYEGMMNQAVQKTTESYRSINSTITNSLSILSKYTEDTFSDWINWISDAIRAMENLAKSIEAVKAAQKGLEGESDNGSMDFSSIVAALSSIGSMIGLFVGMPMASGGVVPQGYPNDTYPALLTSGETVVPPHKLKNYGGDTGGEVKFRIEGNVLVGMLQKMNRKNNLR